MVHHSVDMFDPFLIKEGRKELKRYGALFTCLASRAVHIECTCSMDTYSFIQALQRFIAGGGNIRVLHSDNGSNFVGTQKKLGSTFKEMYHQKIQYFVQSIGADCIIYGTETHQLSVTWEVFGRGIFSQHSVVSLEDTWKIIKK